ncbi:MAG: hypothetical protein OXU20_41985 [Myxococcales bacterium]|nr:hypothetical protein [Myxococcales bacterium]MDD9968711.1 hypothetical protein [Myxococcales bacterium]
MDDVCVSSATRRVGERDDDDRDDDRDDDDRDPVGTAQTRTPLPQAKANA